MKHRKTIALFISLLSMLTLNGMKRNLETIEPLEPFPLGELPIEAKAVIVTQMIYTCDNLDDISTTIEATRFINKEFNSVFKTVHSAYNEIESFTTLVHLLSDKFPKITTDAIANKLKIPIAKKYIELGQQLLELSCQNSTDALDNAKQIIKNGADVNFTTPFLRPTTAVYQIHSPYLFAMLMNNFELTQELMAAGLKEKTIDTIFDTLEGVQKARLERQRQL